MSAVLTQEFGTNNMLSFLNGFTNSPNANMYMVFGRTDPWGMDQNSKHESDFGFVIPKLLSETASKEFIENGIIAGIRILSGDISPVIPRVNWTPTIFEKGTCVITDEWNVYYAKRNVSNTSKPVHTSYLDDTLDWGFLYKISNVDAIGKFANERWIPVDLNGSMGSVGTPNPNAVYLSKSQVLMISKSITTTIISLNDLGDYREIALWANIADANGNLLTDTLIKPHMFNSNSGSIIYVNRRLPVYRSESQSEESQLLLGF